MPQLIEHIDAIARKLKRDVCFLRFSDPVGLNLDDEESQSCWHWEASAIRQTVIEWLQDNQIGWRRCADIADTNYMQSYAGQIYIDVVFDEADPVYQKTAAYLENEDGSPRHPSVAFFVLGLGVAMKNAHHDEPGFWERWAEDF